MKIVIFSVEDWERQAFEDLSDEHDVILESDPLFEETAERYSDADVISVFMYSQVSETVLDALPNLKLIVSRSTGFDHIDLDTCAERGITVCNVPSYGKNTVAEHVFALLLAISHRLEEAFDRTRRGDFSPRGLTGFDLVGKTMGVIGAGEIGTEVARIARGFGMPVVAYDVEPNRQTASEIGFEYADFNDVLRRSDIVSIHVPANSETKNLLSDDQFALMKDGVVLINTARGAVVDVHALTHALADGKVAAAGLDVLPNEPVIREEAELLRSVYEQKHDLSTLLADQVLARMQNVLVTPHSAFNTREAIQRILDTTLENIRSFAAGEPKNTVT